MPNGTFLRHLQHSLKRKQNSSFDRKISLTAKWKKKMSNFSFFWSKHLMGARKWQEDLCTIYAFWRAKCNDRKQWARAAIANVEGAKNSLVNVWTLGRGGHNFSPSTTVLSRIDLTTDCLGKSLQLQMADGWLLVLVPFLLQKYAESARDASPATFVSQSKNDFSLSWKVKGSQKVALFDVETSPIFQIFTLMRYKVRGSGRDFCITFDDMIDVNNKAKTRTRHDNLLLFSSKSKHSDLFFPFFLFSRKRTVVVKTPTLISIHKNGSHHPIHWIFSFFSLLSAFLVSFVLCLLL